MLLLLDRNSEHFANLLCCGFVCYCFPQPYRNNCKNFFRSFILAFVKKNFNQLQRYIAYFMCDLDFCGLVYFVLSDSYFGSFSPSKMLFCDSLPEITSQKWFFDENVYIAFGHNREQTPKPQHLQFVKRPQFLPRMSMKELFARWVLTRDKTDLQWFK